MKLQTQQQSDMMEAQELFPVRLQRDSVTNCIGDKLVLLFINSHACLCMRFSHLCMYVASGSALQGGALSGSSGHRSCRTIRPAQVHGMRLLCACMCVNAWCMMELVVSERYWETSTGRSRCSRLRCPSRGIYSYMYVCMYVCMHWYWLCLCSCVHWHAR